MNGKCAEEAGSDGGRINVEKSQVQWALAHPVNLRKKNEEENAAVAKLQKRVQTQDFI